MKWMEPKVSGRHQYANCTRACTSCKWHLHLCRTGTWLYVLYQTMQQQLLALYQIFDGGSGDDDDGGGGGSDEYDGINSYIVFYIGTR